MLHFNDVWEIYRIKFVLGGKVSWENFWALKGVSFQVQARETVGIIGENGSGKTTLLKIMAGLLKPDRGTATITGRVSGLLEMGAGLQPEMTGRENVSLNLNLFGIHPSQQAAIIDKIISFADIGRFIDAPVKCYSQGMFVRLAFSAAIHVEPEILVIDDILAVGDEFFQKKCIKKVFELRDAGTTIICVTHDMNMLQRLCQRVILMKEGRIIKDGLPENVIPFYTQMVGARGKIAVLTKDLLSVVFNNGRLFLNWQDQPVTAHSGAYNRFLIDGRNYHSFQADWDVVKDGENRFVARGRIIQLSMTLVWKVEIAENSALTWDVEIETDEVLDIQEGYINLLLRKEYADWFTPSEKGHFLLIDESSKDWQPLLEKNIFHECMGVSDPGVTGLPSVIFESRESSCRAEVLNTDYSINSRVLQYKVSGAQHNKAPQSDQSHWFTGKILLNVADKERYLQSLQSDYTVGLDTVNIVFRKGQFDIVSKGPARVVLGSVLSSIQSGGHTFLSTFAQWSLEKFADSKIRVRTVWPGLPIVQVLTIEAIGGDSFCFRVSMVVSEEVDIEQQMVHWVFLKDYTSLFYGAFEQDFPDDFQEYEVDVLQRCIRQSDIGIFNRKNEVPEVVLNVRAANDNYVKFFNSDIFSRSRYLFVCKVQSENTICFQPGEYECFQVESSLGKKRSLPEKQKYASLRQGALSFTFDQGRGHVFWKGAPLTKQLGLYSSLRCGGVWYSSVSAVVWNIKQVDAGLIEVEGDWHDLPLHQQWEIRLLTGNELKVQGWIRALREVEVEAISTNLMLSERYGQWHTLGARGVFPDFKANIDDFWEVVHSRINDDEGGMTVFPNLSDADKLPEISILPCHPNVTPDMNIVNSDLYHRGRVLQYIERRQHKLGSQEKVCFMARFHVNG